jgi:hypothetical protein
MALAGIAVGTFFVEGLKYSVPSFLAFLLAITAFYRTLRPQNLKQKNGSEYSRAPPEEDS